MIELEGNFRADDYAFGIVVSRSNPTVTRQLLVGCVECLVKHGADPEAITIVWAPGAMELPWVAQDLAETFNYDAIICLGCIIRGETDHHDHVANQTARGIAKVSLESGTPVTFGLLTTDTLEQAIERAGAKSNKGFEFALNAIESASLKEQLCDLESDELDEEDDGEGEYEEESEYEDENEYEEDEERAKERTHTETRRK